MSKTDLFIDYLLGKKKLINRRIIDIAKRCLIDFIAVSCAGAAETKACLDSVIRSLPRGESPIIGTNARSNDIYACAFNSFNSHVLELDDGNRFAMMHLGAEIIPALISLSERNHIPTDAFYSGLILGYEAACKLSIAIQPAHKNAGFHTSGTCGSIGAALACGFALGYSSQQLKTTLSCAATSAAGLLEIQENPSQLKPFNVCNAASTGFMAAVFGQSSLLPPDDILGGKRGFFKLFGGEDKLEEVLSENSFFEIERIYVKPYAACRHCHPAIEAALSLRDKINLDEIKAIDVYTYRLAIKGHDHKSFDSESSAKLSIPYCVAVSLITGRCGISEFKFFADKRVCELAKKVNVIEDPLLTNGSKSQRAARVSIISKNGNETSLTIENPKGDPENPMSLDELIAKFAELTGGDPRYQMILNGILSDGTDIHKIIKEML